MLIKAALCEDCSHDQEMIRQLIQRWESQKGLRVDLSVFADTSKLIDFVGHAFQTFDVYFLDIAMNRPQEGLELAKIIRRKSEDIPIIFITEYTQLAYDGFKVNAFHFVGKQPIDEEQLFATLDRLAQQIEQRRSMYFTYVMEGKHIQLPVSEVLYLCTYFRDGHYIVINGDDNHRFRGKLKDILANERYSSIFVMCHQSNVVNISHIRSFSATILVLSDKTQIPISRAYLESVRQCFAAFHR